MISVVIPAYNAAKTIGAALRSVRDQTYSKLQILVVDDGSDDATAAVVREMQCLDNRIVLFSQANSGVAAARNKGVAHSVGLFVAPLDADDVWHPAKLEKQIAIMENSSQTALVYCFCRTIDECGRIVHSLPEARIWGHALKEFILSNPIRSASSPLIRTECLKLVGGYNTGLRAKGAQGCEDLDLYLKLSEGWTVGVVPEFLVGYRCGHDRMSQNARAMWRSWQHVMSETRKRHPEVPDPVFRLGEANFLRWLAFEAVRRREVIQGLRPFFRATCLDPSGTPFRDLSTMVFKRLHLIGAGKLGHSLVGRDFFSVSSGAVDRN